MSSECSMQKPTMTITAIRPRNAVNASRQSLGFMSSTANLFFGLWKGVAYDVAAMFAGLTDWLDLDW